MLGNARGVPDVRIAEDDAAAIAALFLFFNDGA
jgi:hypothetical protein